MSRFLFIIQLLTAACCLWCSCTAGDSEMEKRLFAGMDSLLEANPDSAYKVLTAMQKEVDSIDEEAVSMRHRMHLASAANKLFLPMPSDSSFMDVVSWYDLHGTANDRMRAYYLLGCIYRDRMDAPKALRNYQQALECADTLSPDCDLTSLYKIYGQISSLYESQSLYDEAFEMACQYSKYAEKAGNSFEHVRGEEMLIPLYLSKGDTARMFAQTNKIHDRYMAMDMPEMAARVYPTAIYTYLSQKNYERAHELMSVFESESDLFDGKGELPVRYSRYYLAKGNYCQAIGELDSAEFYYRRLLAAGHEYDAFNSLWCLFNIRANNDSVCKYTELLNKSLDKQTSFHKSQSVTHVTELFERSKLNERLQKTEKKSNNIILICVVLLLIVMLITFFHYFIVSRLRHEKGSLLIKLRKREKKSEKKSQKEQLVEGLNAFAVSEPVKHLKSVLMSCNRNSMVEDEEWNSLLEAASEHIPFYYSKIIEGKLSRNESLVALLVLLNFSTYDMRILLTISSSHISNIKKSINKKLFNDNSAVNLNRNMKIKL